MRQLVPSLLLLALALPAHAGHCPIPGDIAPSPGGDGEVTVADVVVALRWAVGAAEPADEHEARVADVAPVAERSYAICALEELGGACAPEADGDGEITIGDVVVILRAAVGHPLEWRLWSSRTVLTGLPEHLAVRWRVPGVPVECDGPVVAAHAEVRSIPDVVPCASTLVEPWPPGDEPTGLRVTCEHGEARSGNGAVAAFWRAVTPPPWAERGEHAPDTVDIRLPSGAWQPVRLR